MMRTPSVQGRSFIVQDIEWPSKLCPEDLQGCEDANQVCYNCRMNGPCFTYNIPHQSINPRAFYMSTTVKLTCSHYALDWDPNLFRAKNDWYVMGHYPGVYCYTVAVTDDQKFLTYLAQLVLN